MEDRRSNSQAERTVYCNIIFQDQVACGFGCEVITLPYSVVAAGCSVIRQALPERIGYVLAFQYHHFRTGKVVTLDRWKLGLENRYFWEPADFQFWEPAGNQYRLFKPGELTLFMAGRVGR